MDKTQAPLPAEARDIRFESPTFIDPLTGLFNQYYLYQFLPEELKKAKLSNYPLTIFMIDLDGFKEVNDTYGHLCGDEVLKQLAALLKQFVRQTDMVIRYAGDEFAILLPAADQARAENLAKRLVEEIAKNIFKGKDNQQIQLTISLGLATYPDDAQEIDKLIDLADKALYLSKGRGKNKVSLSKEVTLEAASYLIAMDSFPCAKFIDRQAELDKLKEMFNTVVKANLLQLAFICGESGAGKTRLLSELNNYAQDTAALIHCRASSTHTQDPYYLFAKGISNYIDKIGINTPFIQALFFKLPAEELAELSRLIPAVAYLVKKPVNLEKSDKNVRFLLFKAFLDVLIELNNISPVLISFDDIHWADKASLELLRYLSKQEKNKRIFIISSFSEEKSPELTSNADFKALWEDLHFNENFTQLKLSNFSLADASLMMEAIFSGIGAEKDFSELIYNATGGNPSFIEEILKSLVENAIIFYQDNRWQIKKGLSRQDIPFSIEEVIKKRLKNLDEETKEMIVQAAVIGDGFSLEALKQINNQDEGFMLELLSRAKKMRLVDELEPKGNFGFINKSVQNLLYNELNEEQRKRLHYKIGESIAKEHKDNPYEVAGEAMFHFNQASEQEKTSEYSALFSEKITQLFNPAEALEYLQSLMQEAALPEEKISPAPALSEKMLVEAMRFIRLLQGAIKSFQLYPAGVMRSNAIKETHALLNIIWQEVGRFNLAEVEKSLVINGQRISPKEIEQANIQNLLTLLIEYNLKTVSFIKGVTPDELDKFVRYLSQSYVSVRDKGGWTQVVKEEDIRGIKIEEVRFAQPVPTAGAKEFSGKKKLEDAMLMEFLLGKIGQGSVDMPSLLQNMRQEPQKFAQLIMQAAEAGVKEGKFGHQLNAVSNSIARLSAQILDQEPLAQGDYAHDLARVILELKPALRSRVIRAQILDASLRNKEVADNIIRAASSEVIIEAIIEECQECQENPLVVKDFLNKVLSDDLRRKESLPKLEIELSKLKMTQQDIAFITGQIKWEELPLEKRLSYLMKLPEQYYQSEMERIKALLEELAAQEDRAALESALNHLLLKSKQLPLQTGRNLLKMVTDFVKAPFFDESRDRRQMEDRLGGFLKRLNTETEAEAFAGILEIFKEMLKEFTLKLQAAKNFILEIEKTADKKNTLFIHQLIFLLAQRFKGEEERNPHISRLISDFMRDISHPKFLEFLVYSLVVNPEQIKSGLKDIFPLMGEQLADTLINLESQKTMGWGDSFREYLIRKGIISLFQELGEPAIERLRQRFSQSPEEVSASLIELVGYLKKEELMNLLLPFLRHKDPFLRRAAIMALGDIGTEKSARVISELLQKEKDRNIIILAKEQLKKLKAGG